MCQAVGQVPGTLIDWAAGVIGIPCAVVSQQITLESGGQLGAVSPTGAQGPAQFEPGTWSQQGCSGSPFVANDAMKCYAQFMYQLVQQFHGNVRDALAAYNAGPGNLQAGYGYADAILSASGQASGLKAGQGDPGSALTQAAAQQAQAGDDCAFSIGGQHIGILFGHGPSLPSACLVRKTEVRALIGGLLLAAGALMVLPGLVIVMAYGFKASGAAAAVGQAAQVVPGPYGKAISTATRTARTRRVTRQAGAARTAAAERARGDRAARRAAGAPAQQARAVRGVAPRQRPPAAASKPPPEVAH